MSNIDPFEHTGSPSLSFANAPVGTSYTGVVTKAPDMVQSRNFDTGKPDFWDDGNPKMSVVISLNVNGEPRSLWAPKPSAMFSALGQARNALGRAIREGDTVTVTFTGEKPNENPRKHPMKLYSATVTPGTTDVFAQEAAPAPAQAPAAPAPAAQPAAPAPGAQPAAGGFLGTLGAQADPDQLQAALASLPPEVRAQLTGGQG